jgi:histidyl-tRNA synthetase
MSSKPSIPKGTRDFSTKEMLRRDYIFETIKQVFRSYGYQPIETPAVEQLSTLMGKYGEEGDRLLFRILNSGNFLSSVSDEDLTGDDPGRLASLICEKGLRYDLTVPFARFVVQHRNEILFPFKRYQIQPVWRADKPQRGRYREFFQCDADVIGSDSLLNEYELLKIIDDTFERLKLKVVIRLNNRKILAGIADYIGAPDMLTEITVAIDKLEKIGVENVKKELVKRGISDESVEMLQPLLLLKGSNDDKIRKLSESLSGTKTGIEGISELNTLFTYVRNGSLGSPVEFDITLARGLDYYTGAIIEVNSQDVNIGSICGGGRYDNLTGVFGLEGISGVGISFGADRIYDVLDQTGLFDNAAKEPVEVLLINFGEEATLHSLKVLDILINLDVCAEVYPDAVKLKKQMSYANARGIPYIMILGEDEIKDNYITVKVMSSGEQKRIPREDLESFVKEFIKKR